MKFIAILFGAAFFISLSQAPLLAGDGPKIAGVSLGKLFDGYYKTKEVDEKLGRKAEVKNAERGKMVDKINKLKDETELLSEDARKEKERELNDEMMALQDFDKKTRLNLQRERDDAIKDIFKEMEAAIKKYGKGHGYDIIMDDRAMLYVNDKLDLTQEIIKVMNQKK